MKFLVVGLGIGQLYVNAAKHLQWEVDTVDTNADLNPTFTEIPSTGSYDLAVICTPNYVHQDNLDKLLPICKQVLVEKPGLQSRASWLGTSRRSDADPKLGKKYDQGKMSTRDANSPLNPGEGATIVGKKKLQFK